MDIEMIKGFGRAAFNIYAMFLVVFLIAYDKRILPYASAAILLAPLIVLQVRWHLEEGFLINGGRLGGFLQTPIIFGAWMTVVFLVGLGVAFHERSWWKKTLVVLYLAVIANFVLWAASRAAWLAFVFALAVWVWFDARYRANGYSRVVFLASAVAASFVLGFTALPMEQLYMKQFITDRATNLVASIITLQPTRIQSQVHTTELPKTTRFMARHPWGFGFDGTEANKDLAVSPIRTSNNSFLEVARYGGWGALAMFFALLSVIGRAAWLAARPSEQDGPKLSELEMAWLFAGLAFIVSIAFTDGFMWRHTWVALGIMLGIAYVKYPQESLFIPVPIKRAIDALTK